MELVTFGFFDLIVDNFEIYEQLLLNSFRDLRLNSQEYPILVTENAWITRKERERVAELLVEKSQVPAFYLAKNSVLSGCP